MKNVLIIGSGGRESAFAYAIQKSPKVGTIFVSPGSDGLSVIATIVPKMDGATCAEFCKANKIDLVIFGGETELVEGQSDILRAAGISVLGCSKAAAALEGSKDFLKSVLFDADVPCAASKSFTDEDKALEYLATRSMPIVLKTDGLAGGKGVVICEDRADAETWVKSYIAGTAFGDAGKCVVIEDFMTGPEISFFVLVDAKGNAHPLAASRDHKRIFDNDEGPNTGGMGAFTPVVEFTAELEKQIMQNIIEPSLDEMKKRHTPFSGFLFAGLMLTPEGPKLLEYNVRMGDPETQVVLDALDCDVFELFYDAANGAATTPKADIETVRINVVLAAEGYPEAPKKGAEISGLGHLEVGADYFHAGTKKDGDKWAVNGGRVLNILGKGVDIDAARADAYAKIEKLDFAGMQFRKDIGKTEN